MKRLIVLSLFIFVILSQLVKAQEFSITPNIINETTTKEISEKTIIFENFGDSDVNVKGIEISENIKNIVSVIQRPYVIPAKSIATMKIRIDTTGLEEGPYGGIISVLTNGNSTLVFVGLDVISLEEPTGGIEDIGKILENIFPMESIQDHSYIIWYFAIGIVVVIILITILKYRKRKKKKKEKKEEAEEIYYKPQEEYRTEYY